MRGKPTGAKNLNRERQHQPAEHHRRYDHGSEHLGGQHELLAQLFAHERGEDTRHEEAEHAEEHEMALHFRPIAISNASMMTSVLSRPATMMKVFPYS